MSRQTAISKRTAIRLAIRNFMVGEDGIAGAALIEFTLFAPLLVITSIYTMDFGILFYNKMTVQNAAQAGVDWAIANRVYNSSLIQDAALNAARFPTIQITAIKVTSTEFCGCTLNYSSSVTLLNGDRPEVADHLQPTPTVCSGGATCGGWGNYVRVCVAPPPARNAIPIVRGIWALLGL